LKVRSDDDPFYSHDEFGRPLDDDTVARRQVLKALGRMSPDEMFAHLVSLGIYNADGTLTEHYRDNGEPSKHRPTD
jgi:hypothetical protein